MRKTKHIRKIVILIVVIAALAVMIPLGCLRHNVVPSTTGFAAKHLCSLVFVSGLDPERAMKIYVEPVILQLAWFLDYEVDLENRTIRTSCVTFSGQAEAVAAYRRGCGCTLLYDLTADELRAAFAPRPSRPTDLAWEIDTDHRRQFFDEAGLDIIANLKKSSMINF